MYHFLGEFLRAQAALEVPRCRLENLGPHLDSHDVQVVELCCLVFQNGRFEVLPSFGVVPVFLHFDAVGHNTLL